MATLEGRATPHCTKFRNCRRVAVWQLKYRTPRASWRSRASCAAFALVFACFAAVFTTASRRLLHPFDFIRFMASTSRCIVLSSDSKMLTFHPIIIYSHYIEYCFQDQHIQKIRCFPPALNALPESNILEIQTRVCKRRTSNEAISALAIEFRRQARARRPHSAYPPLPPLLLQPLRKLKSSQAPKRPPYREPTRRQMVAMGADELAAALHAPLRSELSSLWGDDDAAAEAAVAVSPSSSSSSAASSPALPPQQQQQPLVAAPSFFFPVGDLSAFLPTHQQQQQQPTASSTMATTPNFLDDLLSSTDDLDFRVRGGTNSSTATSSSSSSVFAQTPLTHSLPPSIQQQLVQSLQAQRQLAAGLGSLTDLELDGAVDPAQLPASLRGATASRLLQLENNYERKKKRAKINRKDLNARFQELMDILNLKEDRKLNRAKVLEKAIEYIERLEDELQAVRSQAEAKKAAVSAPHQVLQQQQQSQQPTAAQMLLPTSSATHAIGGSGSLVAFNPSNAHAWAAAAAAGASSIPMAPMMWLPCSVVAPPPSSVALRAASRVRTEKRSACRGTKSSSAAADAPVAVASARSVSLALPEVSEVSTGGPRRSLKRTREGSAVASASAATAAKDEDSVFVWGAREIPTLLAFCDAWTLVSLLQTSREVAAVARRDALWLELARHRWRLGEALTPNAREQVRLLLSVDVLVLVVLTARAAIAVDGLAPRDAHACVWGDQRTSQYARARVCVCVCQPRLL